MAARVMTAGQIADYLGISVRSGEYLMQTFVQNGAAICVAPRSNRISIRTFAEWLSAHDGSDVKTNMRDVIEFLDSAVK